MMNKAAFTLAALAAVLIFAGVVHAETTVTILAVSPSDGVIAEGETARISWRIESDTSGSYSVEVGGDGTEGSGDQVAASDGSGSFSGTTSGTSTVSADNDLEDGDGDYTIYVIATATDETDYATTTISLDSPPDVVTGLLVRRGDNKLFVSWDTGDDPDIDYFLIYYATDSGNDRYDYDGTEANEGPSPVESDWDSGDEAVLSGLTNEVTYYVRVSAVDESGAEGPLSAEASGTPTDTVGFSELQDDEGECFIATAAYGNYDHDMVRNLRALRDQVLQQTTVGRVLVRAYYTVSPPLAAWVSDRPLARKAVRTALLPLSLAAEAEVRAPGAVSLPLILAFVLTFVLVRRSRRDGETR